jgi:hypothetical protein
MDKRIFNEGDTLKAEIEIANFYKSELQSVQAKWELLSADGTKISMGVFETRDIQIGNGIHLGNIQYPFTGIKKAQKLILEVSVLDYKNSWAMWVYPKNNNIKENLDVLLSDGLDAKAKDVLKDGGKVLLSLGSGRIKNGKGGEVSVGFSSIFWNTAWTNNQAPHTLGILCNPEHPALKYFPTEYHSNWQWWDAMSHSDVINLNEFPVKLKPIVRVVDDWFTNRRLGLLIEVKVGKGKLLVSGIDLHSNLESRPEAKQLLFSLNEYMNSEAFDPGVTIKMDQISTLSY